MRVPSFGTLSLCLCLADLERGTIWQAVEVLLALLPTTTLESAFKLSSDGSMPCLPHSLYPPPMERHDCVSGAHLRFFPLSLPAATALSTMMLMVPFLVLFSHMRLNCASLTFTTVLMRRPFFAALLCLPTSSTSSSNTGTTQLPAYTFTALFAYIFVGCFSNYLTNSCDWQKEGGIISPHKEHLCRCILVGTFILKLFLEC